MKLDEQIRKILDKNRFLNSKEKDQLLGEILSLINLNNNAINEAFKKGYEQARLDNIPKPF